VADGIKAGRVTWTTLANTSCMLKANAVVGVKGFFSPDGKTLRGRNPVRALPLDRRRLVLAGYRKRLDGWPNRDLNVGAIVASAPDLTPFTEMLQVDLATVKKF